MRFSTRRYRLTGFLGVFLRLELGLRLNHQTVKLDGGNVEEGAYDQSQIEGN